MKPELMDILCCPVCKNDLELKVEKEQKGEVLEGSLICRECFHTYRIKGGIPNLLPPDLDK